MESRDHTVAVDDASSVDLAASVAEAVSAQAFAGQHMATYVDRLRTIVNEDTGADSPQGRERVATQLAEWAEQAGCECEFLPSDAGSYLVARLPGSGSGRIVLLGHHDTVFERGTAAARPFVTRNERAFGPGVADMKGGLLVGLLALEAMGRGQRQFEAVELYSAPDEEVRTAVFPALDRMRDAVAVLVFECGRENGDLVIGRKAGAWVRMATKGRSAHAGTEPKRGQNALLGLCRELLRTDALNERRPGLTVMAATFSGGTMANVVPERAQAVLDIRAASADDLSWALGEIATTSLDAGLETSITVEGPWPGIEPNPGTATMFAVAKRLATAMGTAVGGQTSGGLSDGCWTADVGVATLDGLGPVGGRDHSPDEYILLQSVPARCGLTAGLCDALGRGLLTGQRLSEGGPPEDTV
ncbi:MAG: M20/M25/M40 family metallo-hydrolase [Thermoleophilia bacterium]